MTPTIDDRLGELKARLATVWTTGDYAVIAEGMRASADRFAERHRASPGEKVLDVACGSGQVAVPMARAGAEATGIDIAPGVIDSARARAAAEGVSARFDVGDAEALPYPDHAFDLVVSLIGAMFAPRPAVAVAEMARVCRPGGRIVMGNWTPEGFIGSFFRTVGAHAPPPDMPSPLLWGEEERVRARFAEVASAISVERGFIHFDVPLPPEELVPHYERHFGPLATAIASLGPAERRALREDLVRLWSEANGATDGTTQVDGEILEVVVRRA